MNTDVIAPSDDIRKSLQAILRMSSLQGMTSVAFAPCRGSLLNKTKSNKPTKKVNKIPQKRSTKYRKKGQQNTAKMVNKMPQKKSIIFLVPEKKYIFAILSNIKIYGISNSNGRSVAN